jgi:hypothetical protein
MGRGWWPLLLLRRLLGLVGLVIAALGVTTFPLLFYTARVFGAAGDDFQRVLMAYGIGIVFACVVGVVGLADWSLRSIVRSRAMWVVVAALSMAIAWTIYGIDSTRSVRALPEASLAFPGAVETSRFAVPAEGGGDAIARAGLTIVMTSDAKNAEIEAFYAAELTRRGWTYTVTYGSPSGAERSVNWDRGGFTVQLRFLSKDIQGTGTFEVAIYGPVQ